MARLLPIRASGWSFYPPGGRTLTAMGLDSIKCQTILETRRLDPGVIFLQKPATLGELARKVRAALDTWQEDKE